MSLPIRRPLKQVHILECSKDNVCPPGGAVVLTEEALKLLLENLANTEIYLMQMELLLNELVVPMPH